MKSPFARIYSAYLIFASIIGFSGSIYLANLRFCNVYSCPQKTNVSFGRLTNFYKLKNNYSAEPPSKRPAPAINKVSPQNKNGILVLSGATCVTMKLT